VVFFYNLLNSIWRGEKAERNPWQAASLEWYTPDVPPGHGNFGEELPVIYRWAYSYGVPGTADDFTPQHVHPDEVRMAAAQGD